MARMADSRRTLENPQSNHRKMSLTKEQIETAALMGYHDLEVTKWGGEKIAVRLRLPRVKELAQVMSPNLMDENKRLAYFIESPKDLNVDDLTYESEETLASAIKDFFDMALARHKARTTRDEALGGALAARIQEMASILQEWQRKLQSQPASPPKP
jgi:hypothetical protein